MLALLIPFFVAAILVATTLGLSFVCIELVLRGIGRALHAKPALSIRRPAYTKIARNGQASARTIRTRLRAIAAQ